MVAEKFQCLMAVDLNGVGLLAGHLELHEQGTPAQDQELPIRPALLPVHVHLERWDTMGLSPVHHWLLNVFLL